MEENLQINCYNCSKPLPQTGYFCGGCLTQVKCKSCGSSLEKDDAGCVNCGAPKLNTNTSTASRQNINTFRLHETATDRTIEATFSDDVAKDLAGTLRDAAAGRMRAIASNIPPSNNFNGANEETEEFAEAEVINNDNGALQTEAISKPISTPNTAKLEEYPLLIAVSKNNLPSSETEWIVVYAFYASDYGKEIFSRESLLNQYKESQRYYKQTTNRDLSTYIKSAVNAGFINPLQSGYSILDKGVAKAKEVIARTSSSSPKVKNAFKTKMDNSETTDVSGNKSKKNLNIVKSYKRLTDIDFYPSGQKSLTDFIKDFNIKNDNERNLLFTHYLSEVLKITPVTLDHIYTCYDEVNYKIPENMIKSLGNTKTRTGWLKTNNSNIEITIKGINKIKFWDKKD